MAIYIILCHLVMGKRPVLKFHSCGLDHRAPSFQNLGKLTDLSLFVICSLNGRIKRTFGSRSQGLLKSFSCDENIHFSFWLSAKPWSLITGLQNESLKAVSWLHDRVLNMNNYKSGNSGFLKSACPRPAKLLKKFTRWNKPEPCMALIVSTLTKKKSHGKRKKRSEELPEWIMLETIQQKIAL